MTMLDSGPVDTKVRRPIRTKKLTAGHVVPVVLAVLAFVTALAVLRDRSAQTPVLVAAQRIPAGSPINASNTKVASIRSSDAAHLPGLLRGSVTEGGLVATTAINAGQPIVGSETATGPAAGTGLGEISIPVPMAQAAGGALAVGDRVDVISASASGATYVAEGLSVVATAPSSSGGVLSTSTGSYWVAVAADRQAALAIAAALGASSSGGGASLEVVRSTSEAPSAGTPQSYSLHSASCGSGSSQSAGRCG